MKSLSLWVQGGKNEVKLNAFRKIPFIWYLCEREVSKFFCAHIYFWKIIVLNGAFKCYRFTCCGVRLLHKYSLKSWLYMWKLTRHSMLREAGSMRAKPVYRHVCCFFFLGLLSKTSSYLQGNKLPACSGHFPKASAEKLSSTCCTCQNQIKEPPKLFSKGSMSGGGGWGIRKGTTVKMTF